MPIFTLSLFHSYTVSEPSYPHSDSVRWLVLLTQEHLLIPKFSRPNAHAGAAGPSFMRILLMPAVASICLGHIPVTSRSRTLCYRYIRSKYAAWPKHAEFSAMRAIAEVSRWHRWQCCRCAMYPNLEASECSSSSTAYAYSRSIVREPCILDSLSSHLHILGRPDR